MHTLRRFIPIAALCLATLLGGCVVVPEGGYRHGWHGGWHDGWHRW
jgi:hypothetical protein